MKAPLRSDHPAILKGTTIYLKTVKAPDVVKRLIQPASTNTKLKGTNGRITKGAWKGLPMYALTLEERKTCPKSCEQWNSCYGNNMPFANRIDHKSAKFMPMLAAEVKQLLTKHPQGIVMRLHVLGDFYSVGYVNFWLKLKTEYPKLQIFGYTHRPPKSPIGAAVQALNSAGAWIRWSDPAPRSGHRCSPAVLEMSATVIPGPIQDITEVGILCPQQTGKTKGCATCGLCWAVKQPILFLRH